MEVGKLTAQTVAGFAWFEKAALDAYQATSKAAEQRIPRRKQTARKLPQQTRRPPPRPPQR